MEQMQKDNYFFHTEKLTVGYNGVPLIQDIEIGLKIYQSIMLVNVV